MDEPTPLIDDATADAVALPLIERIAYTVAHYRCYHCDSPDLKKVGRNVFCGACMERLYQGQLPKRPLDEPLPVPAAEVPTVSPARPPALPHPRLFDIARYAKLAAAADAQDADAMRDGQAAVARSLEADAAGDDEAAREAQRESAACYKTARSARQTSLMYYEFARNLILNIFMKPADCRDMGILNDEQLAVIIGLKPWPTTGAPAGASKAKAKQEEKAA